MSRRRGKKHKKPEVGVSTRPRSDAAASGHQSARRGARLDDSSLELHESYYAGPLPPADEMERYARLDPNAVTIILGQFNEQGRHRRALEAEVVGGSETRANRGQFLAAGLVALGIAGGVAIATLGDAPIPGAGLGSASIGSGALIYIIGGRPPKTSD